MPCERAGSCNDSAANVIVLVSEAVVSDSVVDLTEDVERIANDIVEPAEVPR